MAAIPPLNVFLMVPFLCRERWLPPSSPPSPRHRGVKEVLGVNMAFTAPLPKIEWGVGCHICFTVNRCSNQISYCTNCVQSCLQLILPTDAYSFILIYVLLNVHTHHSHHSLSPGDINIYSCLFASFPSWMICFVSGVNTAQSSDSCQYICGCSAHSLFGNMVPVWWNVKK